MKIALISTIALRTPPAAYGGTELVVAELAKGLTRRGHEVVTFATGDSQPHGKLRSFFDAAIWPPDDLAEMRHAAFAFREIGDSFDVVHVHHAAAIPFSFTTRAACVATVHHDRVPRLNAHYAAFPDVTFVSISQRQAELSPEVRFGRTIHHGVDPDLYPEGDGSGDYAMFLGRFAPSKGTHVALDVARMANLPIRLGGSAHEVDDAQRYFKDEVEPRMARLGDKVVWNGEVSHEPKLDMLRGARALLFPIDWEEPFGLVMIESMLVGTPVIAYPRGAVPEVIDEGVTGFIVNSPEEMAARLRDLEHFDRRACRARARDRWSTDRMARDYDELYADLCTGRSSRRGSARALRTKEDHGATASAR